MSKAVRIHSGRRGYKNHSRKYRRNYLRISYGKLDAMNRSGLFERSINPTHLIICPTMSSDGRELTENNVQDLIWHSNSLKERLDLKKKRHTAVWRIDHKTTAPIALAGINKADKIYIIGHCNGETFGSKNSGFIDFTAATLADFLITTGLLRPGVTVKLMACYTASVVKSAHVPFAQQVAESLAAKGYKGLKVRGYDGETKESKRSGMLRTVCTPLYSFGAERAGGCEGIELEEGEIAAPVAASKAAHDFSL